MRLWPYHLYPRSYHFPSELHLSYHRRLLFLPQSPTGQRHFSECLRSLEDGDILPLPWDIMQTLFDIVLKVIIECFLLLFYLPTNTGNSNGHQDGPLLREHLHGLPGEMVLWEWAPSTGCYIDDIHSLPTPNLNLSSSLSTTPNPITARFIHSLLPLTHLSQTLTHHWDLISKDTNLTQLDVMQSHPLCRTHFSQYQVSSAVLRWPGGRDYSLMHRMLAMD